MLFEGVLHVFGKHNVLVGVIGVGDGVPDDALKEHLECPTGHSVDQPGDAHDAAPTSQPADVGRGDAMDVASRDLLVPLCATPAWTYGICLRPGIQTK